MAIGPDELQFSEEQERRLRDYARSIGLPESAVISAALDEYLSVRDQPEISSETCHEKARKIGMIGIARGLPSDLSTNPAYFEGFGRE